MTPPAEQLDIELHDAEEFSGKRVIWNGVDYIVGEYIGSGASKYVHTFINAKSGVCHHVIKIWRSLEEARAFAEKDLPFHKFFYEEIFPPTYSVTAHGGAFEVQDYLGPYQDEANPTTPLMKQGDAAINRRDYETAIAIHQQILAINPFHTGALTNCAYALSCLDRTQEAFEMAMRALQIEPNYLLYYRSFFQYAGAIGYLRACLDQFEIMRSRMYLEKEDFELGIQIYLAFGRPEEAQVLLESRQALKHESNDKELAALIRKDLDDKNRAKALTDKANRASSNIEAIALFEKLRALYLKEPSAVINVACALRQRQAYQSATELFLSMIYAAPMMMLPVCLTNAAFCATLQGDYDAAIGYFETAMAILDQQGPITPWDIPGLVVWVTPEGASMEEPPAAALELITMAKNEFAKTAPVPEGVIRLSELYQTAAEEHAQADSTDNVV